MSDMRHEISNHEVEIRILEEKFNNQQIAIESLRQRLIEAGLDQKDLLKGNSAKDNIRISNLESSVKSAVSDLHKLQTHANDTTKTLSQYKKKMQELNQNITALQSAIRSLMDALQISYQQKIQIYKVENGDTLEKIARKHKTTIKALKELNNLKSDRIYIGQNLKLL